MDCWRLEFQAALELVIIKTFQWPSRISEKMGVKILKYDSRRDGISRALLILCFPHPSGPISFTGNVEVVGRISVPTVCRDNLEVSENVHVASLTRWTVLSRKSTRVVIFYSQSSN
jgi:hypothetical protein